MKISKARFFSILAGVCSLLLIIGCNRTEDQPTAFEPVADANNPSLYKESGGDWVENPANGHSYRLTEPMNWMEAEAQAQEWGGHLVTVNNPGEEAWLVSQFGALGPFWIGFNDIAEEGNWVWVSGDPVKYTNWAPGEPNNYAGVSPPPIGSPENAAAVFWYPGLDEYKWNDVPEIVTYPFGVVEKKILEVIIDIKPGSDPNSINPNSKGVIPVAILTSDNFDATTVDPLTVEFGPNAAKESHGKGHIEDVDFDGDMDLVLHFMTQETGIQCGDTEASLTGETYDGQRITGSDAIQSVGCNKKTLPAADITVNEPGFEAEVFLSGLSEPRGVAFHGNGVLFLLRQNGQIFRVNPSGEMKKFVEIETTEPPEPIFIDIVLDPSLGMFVTQMSHGAIFNITFSGKITKFATGLDYPIYLALDPERNLYATENRDDRIVRFDYSGNPSPIIQFDTDEDGDVGGIVFDSQGKLYVLSRQLGEVRCFDIRDASALPIPFRDGHIVATVGYYPNQVGITFGPDDDLFVSSKNDIFRVKLDGTVTSFASGLVGPWNDINTNVKRDLYVSDTAEGESGAGSLIKISRAKPKK